MSTLGLGTVIASTYHVERVLGRGGMGTVFLATELATGRRVAVKVLEPALADQPELLARFRHEAEVAKAIGHPGVVQVLGSGFDLGVHYLVMELLEGESAEQLIGHVGPLPPAQAAAVVVPVLDVLEVAHAAGIVHRDLKPANVFLSTGPPRAVKVLDFGIALGGKVMTRLTQAGMAMGTVAYMAPEQLRDASSATAQADLYSVGAMLFELLAGRPPFAGASALKLMEQIVTAPAPALTSLAPATPPRLAELVERLLGKSPAGRPASAAAVRAELLAIAPPDLGALFADFEGASRRSAIVVLDDSDGLGATFQRPSPQLPRVTDRPVAPSVSRPPPAVAAGPPAEQTARATRTADSEATAPGLPPSTGPAAPRRWIPLATGLAVIGLLTAGYALGRAARRPDSVPETPPPAWPLPPRHPRPTPPTHAPAPAPAKPFELAAGSELLPAAARPGDEKCWGLVREAERLAQTKPRLAKMKLLNCLVSDPRYGPANYLWGMLIPSESPTEARRDYLSVFLDGTPEDHPLFARVKALIEAAPNPARRGENQVRVSLYQTLAVHLFETGVEDPMGDASALKSFEACLRIAPDFEQCHLRAADAYAATHHPIEAFEHYLRFLELAPPSLEGVGRARERALRHFLRQEARP